MHSSSVVSSQHILAGSSPNMLQRVKFSRCIAPCSDAVMDEAFYLRGSVRGRLQLALIRPPHAVISVFAAAVPAYGCRDLVWEKSARPHGARPFSSVSQISGLVSGELWLFLTLGCGGQTPGLLAGGASSVGVV